MIKVSSKWIFYFYMFVSILAFAFVFAHFGAFVNNGIGNVEIEFAKSVVVDFSSTKAVLTLDLVFLGLPLMAWIVLEGRKIGLKWPSLYLFGSIFILTSAVVPIFLAVRERKVSCIDGQWRIYEWHFIEAVTLINLTLLFIGLGVWFMYSSTAV